MKYSWNVTFSVFCNFATVIKAEPPQRGRPKLKTILFDNDRI